MSFIKKHRLKIIYGFVLILFVSVSVFAGLHHEPWADEAQSWLIARDNDNIIDIFNAVRYEGTVPVWHLILKLAQLLGLIYDYAFVIPLIFSAAGVVLLFMTDAPLFVKVLLPFSYYAMYQGSVFARPYCIVFPAMMLIALSYKDRQQKPVRFFLALVMLASTSSYGVIVSGSFMLWELITMARGIVSRKNTEDHTFTNTYRACFWGAALLILLFILMALPAPDCSFNPTGGPSLMASVTEAFLFRIDNPLLISMTFVILCLFYLLCIMNNIIQAFIYTAPLALYMEFFYHQKWHIPYMFFLIVTLMILLNKDFKLKVSSNKALTVTKNAVITGLLALLGFSGFYAAYNEYKYPYYPSKEIAEYIRPYVEQGAVIDMYQYYPIAVQPYFDKNIFANNPTDKSYFIWKETLSYVTMSEPVADIIMESYYDYYVPDPEKSYLKVFSGYQINKFKTENLHSFKVYIRKDFIPEDQQGE